VIEKDRSDKVLAAGPASRCRATSASFGPFVLSGETLAGNATGDAIADRPPGTGDHRPAVGRGRTIGRHCGRSAHLMSALTRL